MADEKLGTPASAPCQKSYDISIIEHIGKKSIVCYTKGNDPKEHLAKGRVGQALFSLVKKTKEGITPLYMGTWALRLATSISHLRHKHNLDIVTVKHPQDDGQGIYGSYHLQTPVIIKWYYNR